ncbi:MAG: leucine-rich repeat protein [Lachnospiraceae bacterium]
MFLGNYKIKKVVIEDGITAVGEWLFNECKAIESITLPASLTKWGVMPSAFTGAGCSGYTVASDNTVYQAIDGSLYSKDGTVLYDYVKASGVTEFTVPSEVTTIWEYGFDDNVDLDKLVLAGDGLELKNLALFYPDIKQLEIAEGVKTLGDDLSVEGLLSSDIELPSTLTSLGKDIFLTSNAAISKVTVAADNPVFYDIDGVVLTKEGKLVAYPAGKTDTTYRTPDQVLSIRAYAFCGNEYLKELELGGKMQSVENQGINQVKALEKLTVYNPECTFASQAVYYCNNLTTICGEADSSAETLADNLEVSFEEVTCNITSAPVVPATMEADGIKAHYQCSDCYKKFLDEAGSQLATEDSLKISKVASVAFTQSEYDFTIEYAAKGWAQHVVVTDSDGKQLKYGTDYTVKQIGENLFGVCSASVEGKGNYNFKKQISCTVHPSSTLRIPADIEELNHGSYTIDLYGDTKTYVINGDERIMSYASISALITVDNEIGEPIEQTLDLDMDGSADVDMIIGDSSLCEGGESITMEVLPTCSVKENITFTLSETAQNYLKTTLLCPYYENITFRLDPCTEGHSYGSEWKSDATGHWKVCSVCSNKNVEKHVPGPEATATTPQTCTVCGYVIAPAKGNTGNTETNPPAGNTEVKVPEAGTTLTDAGNKVVYKVTGTDTANPTVEYTKPVNSTEKTITIPDTVETDGVTYQVTSIAADAFKNNKKMTKVTIGSNIKTIGDGAFSGCTKLKTVTIGKNVTTIGDKAFYKCTALTKITIPSNVTMIGKSAFYGCKNLKNITIKTTKLTDKTVGSKAFKGIHSKATITVPKSKLKAYTALLKKKGIGKGVKVKK